MTARTRRSARRRIATIEAASAAAILTGLYATLEPWLGSQTAAGICLITAGAGGLRAAWINR